MAPKAGKEWRVVGDAKEEKTSEGGKAKEGGKGKKDGGKGKRGNKDSDGATPWSKQTDDEEDGSNRRKGKGKGRKGGGKQQATQGDDYYGEDDGSWGKGWNAGWDSGWDDYGSKYSGSKGQQKSRSKGGSGGGKRDGGYTADYSTGADEEYFEGYDYGNYGAGYGYPYAAQDGWNAMQQQVEEPAPPPPPPRKSEWTEYTTPEGDVYYHSSKTGLTQWERPPELDPPKQVEPEIVPQEKSEDTGHNKVGGGRGKGHGRDDAYRDEPRRGGGEKGDGDGGARRGRDSGDGPQRGGGRRGGGGKKDGRSGGGAQQDKDASDFGPPGCNLFVFHLPDDWTDDDLHEYFAPHGSVMSAKVMKELGTGRSRGFGFVSYEDRVSAATAIKKMQGYKILGKRLKVEFKKGEGMDGAAQDGQADQGQEEDSGAPKKSYPDDERLIGYLRAISAKNVVTALKESENPDGADIAGSAAADPEEAYGAEDAADDAES